MKVFNRLLIENWHVRLTMCCLLLAFLEVTPAEAQSKSEIRNWAAGYCSISAGVMPNTKLEAIQIEQKWELSYQYILHFKDLEEKLKRAIIELNQLRTPTPEDGFLNSIENFFDGSKSFPEEAKSAAKIQSATVQSLSRIKSATTVAIKDIENAINRVLFANALAMFSNSVEHEIGIIVSASRQSTPLVGELLSTCTADLIRVG